MSVQQVQQGLVLWCSTHGHTRNEALHRVEVVEIGPPNISSGHPFLRIGPLADRRAHVREVRRQ